MWHLQLAAAPVTMGVYLIFLKEVLSLHGQTNGQLQHALLRTMLWLPESLSDLAKVREPTYTVFIIQKLSHNMRVTDGTV